MVILPFRTTAENMAKYFYNRLSGAGYPVARVTVWETPTNCAVYDGGEEETWLV